MWALSFSRLDSSRQLPALLDRHNGLVAQGAQQLQFLFRNLDAARLVAVGIDQGNQIALDVEREKYEGMGRHGLAIPVGNAAGDLGVVDVADQQIHALRCRGVEDVRREGQWKAELARHFVGVRPKAETSLHHASLGIADTQDDAPEVAHDVSQCPRPDTVLCPNRYHVEVTLHPPKVPYKETITQTVEVQGRHKKQSGGRGQFGDCKCIFEPLERGGGFEWVDKIFGGAVPQNFRPAIEKGIIEAAATGAIAGYPLVDFKVTLIDGSYHAVDSDEHSFRAAGRKAFRNAIDRAKPTLLEPIMDVEVFTPQEVSGDIMGDLNSRRGRVAGMEMRGKQQVIKAKVPLSEMLDYQSKLNSVTQARGSYHMQFSHYDPLPGNLAQKVIDEAVASGRVRAQDDDE